MQYISCYLLVGNGSLKEEGVNFTTSSCFVQNCQSSFQTESHSWNHIQPSMVEVEASPDCLHGLLKLKRGKTTGSCDFCHQVTNPPHNYLNCPQRPCYLCYRIGHLQTACPFRLSHGAAEAALKALLASRSAKSRPLRYTQASQLEDVISSQLVLRSAQCSLKGMVRLALSMCLALAALLFLTFSTIWFWLSESQMLWTFSIHLHCSMFPFAYVLCEL